LDPGHASDAWYWWMQEVYEKLLHRTGNASWATARGSGRMA
jgi:hypothetical protein